MMPKRCSSVLTVLLGLVFTLTSCSTDNGKFDILIEDGRIVDGTGNPWFYGDIEIEDGKSPAA